MKDLKMKLLTFVSALFLFCQYAEAKDNQAKQSQPKQQSGAIYGGINSNYTYGNNNVATFLQKEEYEVDPIALIPTTSLVRYQKTPTERMSQSGVGFGGFVGYEHTFDTIRAMVDVSYDGTKLKQKIVNEPITTSDKQGFFPVHMTPVDYGVLFTRGNTWSGTLRLGYSFTPSVVFFAKSSLLFSAYYLECTVGSLSKGTKKNLMGIEPGVGVDINLKNGIFFRGEYGYQMFKKFTTPNINPQPTQHDDQIIYSISPRYHTIRMGLGYKFKTF